MPCSQCRTVPAPPPPTPLFQIRHGFRAAWNGLAFSVEADSGQWTVRVRQTPGSNTLYTAYRGGPRAAQLAAAEFAVMGMPGTDNRRSPDCLARQLHWQEYW